MCVLVCEQGPWHVGRSEENLMMSVFPFAYVGPGYQTRVLGLGDRSLRMLGYLTQPGIKN